MLNASYNLNLRGVQAYIPQYPVGTAADCAAMIRDFVPVATALLALSDLKIISFGPRPQDFLACNAPIAPLHRLGIEIEENSELDLYAAFHAHAGDARIPDVVAEMEEELGEGNKKPEILAKLAQYELTLLDWVETHKGARKYVAIAGKCWPAFQTEFQFVPCYVNSRLTAKGIPVSCEVDIYGVLSEFIGTCVSRDAVTLLDINNSVPADLYAEKIKNAYPYSLTDTFMGFHCRQHPGLQAVCLRDEVPENHGTHPACGVHQRHPGGGYCPRSHHLLPAPIHGGLPVAGLCGRGGGAAGAYPLLWRHRCVCHSPNGSVLSPCAH